MKSKSTPMVVLLAWMSMTVACSGNGPSGDDSNGRAGGGAGGDSATGGGNAAGGTAGPSGTHGTSGGLGGSGNSGGATSSGGKGGSAGTGGAAATGRGGAGGASGTSGGKGIGGGGVSGRSGADGGPVGPDGATGVGGRHGNEDASTGVGGARLDGGSGGSTPGPDSGGVFNPCPTTSGTACKVMPLGDSITEGFGASGADGGGPANQGGYRIELFRQTVTNAKNMTFVGNATNGPTTVAGKPFPQKHEGHGGWTISQIAGIADGSLSTNKPNIIILKIGTNDVNGTGASGAPAGLKNLINQITTDAPSALLVVSSIIPIKDDNTNQKVKTYNATIPTAVSEAAAAGKHVVFVDSYAAISADSSWKTKLMSDNLHPNDAGYVVLGKLFYDTISSVLPAGP